MLISARPWSWSSNLFSARAFGEFEFWASVAKVGAILIFLAVGLVVVVGRMDIAGHKAGFQNLWANLGGFWPHTDGFVGTARSWSCPASSSRMPRSMVGVAAGEMENAEREVPKAVNAVIMRTAVFYCGSILLLVSMLRPVNTRRASALRHRLRPHGLDWMGVIQASSSSPRCPPTRAIHRALFRQASRLPPSR